MYLPTFHKFDGTIDPTLHLTHFKLSILSTSIHEERIDAIMCKVFPRSVKGATFKLFGELASNTISSYASLVRLFIIHFASYRIA